MQINILITILQPMSSNHLLCLLLSFRLPTEPSLLPILPIAFCEPFRSLHELNNVNPLLKQHHWRAGDGDDPGDRAIHLVGARHFHRGS